jgi:hypothetical protein
VLPHCPLRETFNDVDTGVLFGSLKVKALVDDGAAMNGLTSNLDDKTACPEARLVAAMTSQKVAVGSQA